MRLIIPKQIIKELTQIQRQHIHDSEQIIPQIGHSNRSYKNISTISIDRKSANTTWLKLPSLKTLLHPYVIIHKAQKIFLPIVIYEITPFKNYSGNSHILKKPIITLINVFQNWEEIKTNKHFLGQIMKGIGFHPGSDSGKSAGV
ncbi:hypothetical protein O181_093880 [Austropuccinia psidii MF-1]|uniref:Uncharacterized protein n=1 Tax=Austropuccinia psidii MF-1 TaxID=1389203 RepID=A0A9Q3PAJ4_9BASI|nr:hypothetical protein [Austropuccinia psidii MF-1]